VSVVNALILLLSYTAFSRARFAICNLRFWCNPFMIIGGSVYLLFSLHKPSLLFHVC
jgi:hypothetical protein